MLRVDEPALEPVLQRVEDGLPVAARRLHPHPGHAALRQPVRQPLELADRRPERARLLQTPTTALPPSRHPHRRHHGVAVHVKTGAPLNNHINHHRPPSHRRQDTPSRRGLPSTNLRFALEAAVCGSAGPRATLLNALEAARGMPASTKTAPAFSSQSGDGASAAGVTPYHQGSAATRRNPRQRFQLV